MSRAWSYLTNPFLSATEGSYRTMKKISEFTYSAIKNKLPPPALAAKGMSLTMLTPEDSEFFAELRNDLEPLITAFDNQYTIWQSSYADRKSQTSLLTDLFNQLRSVKIIEWDITIQTVYNSNSPGYKRLLPRKRRPFQSGAQQERLDALRLLVYQIADDTNFDADFITDITDFYNTLKEEYDKQAGEKSDTTYTSHELEPARIALANGLYASLGAMIKYFNAQPDKISSFFDLEDIRRTDQSVFRHKVKPLETYLIMTHTFISDDTVRFVNDGPTTLTFWLAANLNDGPGTITVTVDSHTEKLISASDLGTLTNRYLKVKNPNEFTDGHYVVTLM